MLGFVSGYDLFQYRADIVRKLEFASSINGQSIRSRNNQNTLSRSFSLVSGVAKESVKLSSSKALFDQVEETIIPIKLSKVEVVVSPKSSISFVHQLMALNGTKLDVLPVCEKGRLVGLIYRADLISTLMPKRFKEKQ